MVDYQEAKSHADFWKNNILPYLKQNLQGTVSFSDYLVALYNGSISDRTYGATNLYLYSLDFLKKYRDNCVTFQFNDPTSNAPIMSAIYQFSKSLNVLANIYFWREEGDSDGYIGTFLAYEHKDEMMNFLDNNMDLVKQPKPSIKGFSLVG